jgi:hypothetical protein
LQRTPNSLALPSCMARIQLSKPSGLAR